jgi:hypothetical protein
LAEGSTSVKLSIEKAIEVWAGRQVAPSAPLEVGEMTVAEKASKITVDLGDRALYRALKLAAVQEDMTVREVVIEAVSYWLEHREEIEDRLAAEKADRVETTRDGEQVPLGRVRAEIEHRAHPGSN